jgi:phosphoribosylaminoimidazole-succinocarboxamide synthase
MYAFTRVDESKLTAFGVKKLRSGKVRDLYHWQNELWLVASDRISAFDVILPTPIPGKGKILTQLARLWFNLTERICSNHVISYDPPPGIDLSEWKDRFVRARMLEVIPVECVVRGYLAGSGWKEYQKDQRVGGFKLPANLLESSELPEPLFTPATKAETGHDENLTFAEAEKKLGKDLYDRLKKMSLEIYNFARSYARERGIIIADTKFEFGIVDGKIVLIDEILTPDSSRFWPADSYKPGQSQPSFDKQFIRDYLETLDWNKQAPGPVLPPPVIEKTLEKYQEAFDRLTR